MVNNFLLKRERKVLSQEIIQSDIQRSSFSSADPKVLLVNTKDVNGTLQSVTSTQKPKKADMDVLEI